MFQTKQRRQKGGKLKIMNTSFSQNTQSRKFRPLFASSERMGTPFESSDFDSAFEKLEILEFTVVKIRGNKATCTREFYKGEVDGWIATMNSNEGNKYKFIEPKN